MIEIFLRVEPYEKDALYGGNIDFYYPEAMVHPRNTDKILDQILAKAKEKHTVVVTTMSETLINLIGHRVVTREVSHKWVTIWIEHEDGSSQRSHYNSEGLLVDWPYGWFLPEF